MKHIVFCTSLALALAFSVACEKKAEPVPFDPGPSYIPEDADIPIDPDDQGDGHFSGGRGTQSSPYLIAEAKDLTELRDLINSNSYANFASKFYRQTADINLGGASLRVISTETDEPFRGYYDGGGHSISQAVISRPYDRCALFGGCDGATIRRLRFVGCTVSGKRGTAFVAGWAQNTTIDDCHVEGGSVTSSWTAVGSIVGECKGTTVSNCSSNATVTGANGSDYCGAGGIVGYMDKDASTISTCTFKGTVKVVSNAEYTSVPANGGGIVGVVSNSNATIDNCVFQGSVSGPAENLGGIVGRVGGTVQIKNCQVLTGTTITAGRGVAGGIVGSVDSKADAPGTISNCSVDGAQITTTDWGCAGIAARNYGAHVNGCTVSDSKVHAGGNNAGGVVGVTKFSLNISDCNVSNTEVVSDNTLAGGIVAEMADGGAGYHNQVSGCKVSGSTVKSKYYTGGIAGIIKQGNVLNRCFVSGTSVTSTTGGEAGGIAGKTGTDGIVIANCMYWGGSVKGGSNTSGIGGIVGSFFNIGGSPAAGGTTGTTVVVNCMANPSSVSNTYAESANHCVGGIAGYMAYTRMVSCYCPTAGTKITGAGTDAQDKRGSLYGYLNFGGELIDCYWLDEFKAGYEDSAGTYTKKIRSARGTQMSQTDETTNVVWVTSLYPDGEYRRNNMTAALNECARLYNASSPLYGVTADEWVKTDAYAYPVIKGSPLSN